MKILRTVFVLMLLSATASADEPTYPFDWDTLLAASIKFQDNYDYQFISDSYLRVFEPRVWRRVREDEFQLETERKRVARQFEREVADFSLERDVILHTWLKLGKYNLEKQAFPVTNMSAGHSWSESKDRFAVSEFSDVLDVYLKNYDMLTELPMSPDEAQAFLQRRKDSRGRINRDVEVTLRIRFLGLKRRSKTELVAEIQSARIFHDRRQKLVMRDIAKAKNEPQLPEKKASPQTKPDPIETQTAPYRGCR